MPEPTPIQHTPYMPSDPAVALYSSSLGSFTPYEFSDFRTEEESWKTTAYLHAGLNPRIGSRARMRCDCCGRRASTISPGSRSGRLSTR